MDASSSTASRDVGTLLALHCYGWEAPGSTSSVGLDTPHPRAWPLPASVRKACLGSPQLSCFGCHDVRSHKDPSGPAKEEGGHLFRRGRPAGSCNRAGCPSPRLHKENSSLLPACSRTCLHKSLSCHRHAGEQLSGRVLVPQQLASGSPQLPPSLGAAWPARRLFPGLCARVMGRDLKFPDFSEDLPSPQFFCSVLTTA